jgi:hypothetical protein
LNDEIPRKRRISIDIDQYSSSTGYCVVVVGSGGVAGGLGASAAGGVEGTGVAGAVASGVAGAVLFCVTAGPVEVPVQSNESTKRMPSTTMRAAIIRPVELSEGRADALI